MRKRVRKCRRCGCTEHNQTVQSDNDKVVVIEVCAQCERIYRRAFWKDTPKPQPPAVQEHAPVFGTMQFAIFESKIYVLNFGIVSA